MTDLQNGMTPSAMPSKNKSRSGQARTADRSVLFCVACIGALRRRCLRFHLHRAPRKKESPAPVDTAVTPEPKETETGGADTAEEPDVTGGDTAPEPEPEVKEFYFPMIGG